MDSSITAQTNSVWSSVTETVPKLAATVTRAGATLGGVTAHYSGWIIGQLTGATYGVIKYAYDYAKDQAGTKSLGNYVIETASDASNYVGDAIQAKLHSDYQVTSVTGVSACFGAFLVTAAVVYPFLGFLTLSSLCAQAIISAPYVCSANSANEVA